MTAELPSPTNKPSRTHVFVSYSSEDYAFVKHLVEDLRANNYPVWVDNVGPKYQGIRAGEPWKQALADAINTASIVVLVMSPGSALSQWVSAEIRRAVESEKKVIPIFYKPMETDEQDEGMQRILELRSGSTALHDLHYLDFHSGDYKLELSKLLRSLKYHDIPTTRTGGIEIGPDTLRTASEKHSEIQSERAQGKYIDTAYIEREDFNILLSSFLEVEEQILVVSGNAGVGKSSLLLRFYQNQLRGNEDVIPLWFNGVELNASIGLARSVLAAWDAYFELEHIPTIDEGANRLLRGIVEEHLSQQKLVLLIDGLNENDEAMKLIGRINDFIIDLQPIKSIKIIATSRPQVWQQARIRYLRTRYKRAIYYRRLPDMLSDITLTIENDSFVMKRYNREELESAYREYCESFYIVGPDLSQLNHALQQAIREPLLLRFVCETHQGDPKKDVKGFIPVTKQANDIIHDLIDNYVTNPEINLYADDFDFLQRRLVPQFFPEGQTPVMGLSPDVQVPTGDDGMVRLLDQMVTEVVEHTHGSSASTHLQRLLDTGWLVLMGTLRDYQLRFQYEYFYDYFVGKHILDRYEKAENKSKFVIDLAGYLNTIPFLWGPLHHLLEGLLKRQKYDLVEHLGHIPRGHMSENGLHELLVSVLSTQYSLHEKDLYPRLLRWLDVSATNARSAEITAKVVIACTDEPGSTTEDLLKCILVHPNEQVRLLVAQNIHTLWVTNPGLTERLLTSLSMHISLLTAYHNRERLFTLLQCSLMLVMTDYWKKGAKTETVLVIQPIWQSIFRKGFLASDVAPLENFMKRLRRRFIRFVINYLMRLIQRLENAGEVFFDLEDFRSFFPADERRKEVFRRLL